MYGRVDWEAATEHDQLFPGVTRRRRSSGRYYRHAACRCHTSLRFVIQSILLCLSIKKGKGKGRYSSSLEPHLRATGRHLPYGITQCHLPPDTSKRAPLNPSHADWYSIYLPRRNGRLSWPSWLDSAPAGSRTIDLSITSPTPNRCTTKTTRHKAHKALFAKENDQTQWKTTLRVLRQSCYNFCSEKNILNLKRSLYT